MGEYGSQKIYLRRYKCKTCDKKFVTSLESVIRPHYRYSKIYKDKIGAIIKAGYLSLRKIGEDFQTFFENTPSHQSIKNWITRSHKNRINNDNKIYSGYYSYDEQYLRINGQIQYRLTLYDTRLNIPVAKEIVPKRTPKAIKTFIQESTQNQTLIAITTDHFREFKKIIDEINVKHQLCVFHLFKMLGNKVYKILKSKKISQREKIEICLYFTISKKYFAHTTKKKR